MEIKCNFSVRIGDVNDLYTGSIHEATIIEKNHVIKDFKGVHGRDKSNKDVQCVRFEKTIVDYFPRGLQDHFPNLTHLIILGTGIKEISRMDLKGLEGIIRLSIIFCQLTSLPDDLLIEMSNLQEVSFRGNKIEFASSKILKPLRGRQNIKVDLGRNKRIHGRFWLGSDDSLESLDALMKMIDRKCLKPDLPKNLHPVDFNPLIKEMWTSGKCSDVVIVGGGKNFKVHKTILGMQSEVFAKFFEEQKKAVGINIAGFSSQSVEALLKFMYTNEISDDGNAKEKFEIADKFKVAAMRSIYEGIICCQLDESNAWKTFLFAHRFSSQLLKKKAFQLIAQKFPDDVPGKLMEHPENIKKLLYHRRAYEEILEKLKT